MSPPSLTFPAKSRSRAACASISKAPCAFRSSTVGVRWAASWMLTLRVSARRSWRASTRLGLDPYQPCWPTSRCCSVHHGDGRVGAGANRTDHQHGPPVSRQRRYRQADFWYSTLGASDLQQAGVVFAFDLSQRHAMAEATQARVALTKQNPPRRRAPPPPSFISRRREMPS